MYGVFPMVPEGHRRGGCCNVQMGEVEEWKKDRKVVVVEGKKKKE